MQKSYHAIVVASPNKASHQNLCANPFQISAKVLDNKPWALKVEPGQLFP